jgi:hypothetical protein
MPPRAWANRKAVREAAADYHSRIGRVSESERQRLVKAFDALVPAIPARGQREVTRQLREIRLARRSCGIGCAGSPVSGPIGYSIQSGGCRNLR